jgi:hypothetical protein
MLVFVILNDKYDITILEKKIRNIEVFEGIHEILPKKYNTLFMFLSSFILISTDKKFLINCNMN